MGDSHCLRLLNNCLTLALMLMKTVNETVNELMKTLNEAVNELMKTEVS